VHQEADEGPVITMLCKMAIWRYQIRNAVPGHFPHTPTPANARKALPLWVESHTSCALMCSFEQIVR
jgi:hypothetical protein